MGREAEWVEEPGVAGPVRRVVRLRGRHDVLIPRVHVDGSVTELSIQLPALRHQVLLLAHKLLAAAQLRGVACGNLWRRRRRELVGLVGVDGGDDGEVVLVFVEMIFGRRVRAVERLRDGGEEGSEGELVDVVGEVEGCVGIMSVICFWSSFLQWYFLLAWSRCC